MKFEIVTDNGTVETAIPEKNLITLFDASSSFDWMPQKDGSFTVKLDNSFYKLYNVQVNGTKVSFQHKSNLYQFTVKDEMAILMEKMGFNDSSDSSAGQIAAPMPGKIISVTVAVGFVIITEPDAFVNFFDAIVTVDVPGTLSAPVHDHPPP
jgi:acetyl/propionyl-CoA carboxylase alpha subunit